jgi:pimeloyl-ACP methyl ester carboxylesterase
MGTITHERVDTNSITLHVACAGPSDGPVVVLCHGFPELWYSWRHQIPVLADRGFRVLAPDLRGFGESDAPTGDVAAYGADEVTADLVGLLDAIGCERANFVGHDWGSLCVWELGKLHRDRASSLYTMSVPFSMPPSAPPTQRLDAIFEGRFLYILYFQPVGPAEAELEGDVRGFLRAFFYSASGDGVATGRSMTIAPRVGTQLRDVLRDPPGELTGWLTEHDVDTYVAGFERSGFFGPLSYYRNLDANWARSQGVAPSALSMPTGFLTGAQDPVQFMYRDADATMRTVLPDFRGTTTIEGAGHWVQQERPDAVTAALLTFLEGVA